MDGDIGGFEYRRVQAAAAPVIQREAGGRQDAGDATGLLAEGRHGQADGVQRLHMDGVVGDDVRFVIEDEAATQSGEEQQGRQQAHSKLDNKNQRWRKRMGVDSAIIQQQQDYQRSASHSCLRRVCHQLRANCLCAGLNEAGVD